MELKLEMGEPTAVKLERSTKNRNVAQVTWSDGSKNLTSVSKHYEANGKPHFLTEEGTLETDTYKRVLLQGVPWICERTAGGGAETW